MAETPDAAATPAAESKTRPALIVAVALVAGAGIGGKVVAPMLSHPAASVETLAADEKVGKEAPKVIHMDNVIVNPAGSAGQRYLIVSIAFEVPDAATEDRITRADVQLRDMVTGLLEKQTLADLTKLGARDSLRLVISTEVKRFTGGRPVKVYVPTFLIQ